MKNEQTVERGHSETEIVIRSAVDDDLEELVHISIDIQLLHARGRPDLFKAPDENALRIFIQDQLTRKHTFLAAELSGNIVGYLLAEAQVRSENAFRYASSSMYIHHIAVAPWAQRQGIGSRLIRAAVAEAEVNSFERVRLDSWAFNHQAHAFFESEGLVPINIVFEKQLDQVEADELL